MQISASLAGDTITLALAGRFDFAAHRDFRSAYQDALAQPATRIALDFSGVEYLDSAALGMLLLLRQSAEAAGKAVILAGAAGSVLRILEIANFRKLFEMH